jgi:hypothetical protein
MIFRKATLQDIPAIVDIAVESVSVDALPVKIDKVAMADMIRQCLNPAHFVRVTEVDGVVVAAMVALVQQGFWFHRMQCSVLLYYTRVPGGSVPLLREFAKWVKSRSAIKLAIFELEPGADPRLVKFLNRLGFDRESTNATYVRSAL